MSRNEEFARKPRKNSKVYKEFDRNNQRRLDLINKKYTGGGLDEGEIAELEVCKRHVSEYIAKYCPRDYGLLDEMSERIRSLLEIRKASQNGSARPAGDSDDPGACQD